MIPLIILTSVILSTVLVLGFWVVLFVKASKKWNTIPGTRIKQTDHPFPDAHIVESLEVFLRLWGDEFGADDRVSTAVRSVRIRWFKGTSFDLPQPYSGKATGYVLGGNEMWLATMESENLSRTALFHELVHICLDVIHGTPDPDHEGVLHGVWTETHNVFIRRCKQEFAAWRVAQGS